MRLETISVDLPIEVIDILKAQAEKHDLSLGAYVTEVMVRGALKTVFDVANEPWFVKSNPQTEETL